VRTTCETYANSFLHGDLRFGVIDCGPPWLDVAIVACIATASDMRCTASLSQGSLVVAFSDVIGMRLSHQGRVTCENTFPDFQAMRHGLVPVMQHACGFHLRIHNLTICVAVHTQFGIVHVTCAVPSRVELGSLPLCRVCNVLCSGTALCKCVAYYQA
jgi:hypothetical protein